MYIRRKLYSTFEDENGEERRLYSTTEFIDEDQYLDEALYSDYSDEEPEQKEYASVRKMVKQINRMGRLEKRIDATNSRKILDKLYKAEDRVGAVGHRMNTSGMFGYVNSKSKAKAVEKMSRRLAGKEAAAAGISKANKKEIQKRYFDELKENAREIISRGGKEFK